jgi:hypothetical protein
MAATEDMEEMAAAEEMVAQVRAYVRVAMEQQVEKVRPEATEARRVTLR